MKHTRFWLTVAGVYCLLAGALIGAEGVSVFVAGGGFTRWQVLGMAGSALLATFAVPTGLILLWCASDKELDK